MENRFIAVFAAFCLLIGCSCLRLYVVCSKGTEYVSSAQHGFFIELGTVRGDIFDCLGNPIVSSDYDNVVAAKPTLKALNALENTVGGDLFEEMKGRMAKQNPVALNIGKNNIEQNSDAIAVKVYRRYCTEQTARHLLGYLNGEGHGASGIERCFDDLLFTGKSLGVRFESDVYGRAINGGAIKTVNLNLPKASVTLTLDSRIQTFTENALDMCDIAQGAAIVVDVKSGAIRAMASRPQFDPDNVADSLEDETSPLVNRALEAYSVGSIFKAVVAAAALEAGVKDFSYNCIGSRRVENITFHCNDNKAHGRLNMQTALECSCNSYFIALAEKIGAEKITETASLLGFGQGSELADGITSKAGILPKAEDLKNPAALANFSFGQGAFSATLLQFARVMCTIANKGSCFEPYIIERTADSSGKTLYEHEKGYPVYALSVNTCERMTEMLTCVVENGNASRARLINNVKAAGKTATAQTGNYYKNGVEICNTWFGGFFPADDPQYAIIVIKQGGRSGAEDCAPVFKKIADKILTIK